MVDKDGREKWLTESPNDIMGVRSATQRKRCLANAVTIACEFGDKQQNCIAGSKNSNCTYKE